MGWLYRNVVRPVLFTRDSEIIHNETIALLSWMSRRAIFCDLTASFCRSQDLPVSLWGLNFPNPVGLAAGMDKHASAVPIWPSFGFGFSELGGVTRHAQPGNPSPRMFRAVPDDALINRMGFNNPGAEAMAQTLSQWKQAGRWPRHPVGINLGKSKSTPLEDAASDYGHSLRVLWPLADFFVVNVSSPNTPNLRQLQDKAALREILLALQGINQELGSQPGPVTERSPENAGRKPILVKVAPDLTFEALDEILELVVPCQLAGIVATNTTLARPESEDPGLQRVYREMGGLSGRPLRERSTEVIRHIHRQTRGSIPLIGVGGIFTAEHAWEKITAGASLVQIYSGMVYEGPVVAKEIVEGLRHRLVKHRLTCIQEAVGIANR